MNSLLYSGTPEEKKALNAFCDDWLADSFWPFKEFELSLKIPGTFLVYALDAESMAGLALGRVNGGVSELFFIVSRPDLRGKGLAKGLLIDFEACSVSRYDAVSVLLEVRPTNVYAVRLYESSGYREVGRRKRYYKDGEDALIYEKILESHSEKSDA